MKNPENMTKKELLQLVKDLLAQNAELVCVPEFIRDRRQLHSFIIDAFKNDDYEETQIVLDAMNQGSQVRRLMQQNAAAALEAKRFHWS